MNRSKLITIILIIMSIPLSGCYSNTNSVLDNTKQSQAQLRSYQVRAFDTLDVNKTMRTVIATLQDLDFVIDKADSNLSTVTGTKYTRNRPMKISVSIREKGEKQLFVRANVQYDAKPVHDPIAYQDFFNSLSKSLFIEAQEI